MRSRVPSRQQGMSLVELMIAALLGLIMMAGLTQIFVSNKQTFSMSQALTEVQESGRKGAMILSREIRNADYWGCLTNIVNRDPESQQDYIHNNLNTDNGGSLSHLLDFSEGLTVTENSDPNDDIVDGSHELTVRGIEAGNSTQVESVPGGATPNSAALHVNDASGLSEGDVLLVSDCRTAHIFQATGVNQNQGQSVILHNKGGSVQPGNSQKTLEKSYEGNARVYRPRSLHYFIEEDANGRRSLVVESTASTAYEVLANVQDMRIRLGVVDDNGQLEHWTDNWMNDPVDMDNVQAVEISLLARSSEGEVTEGTVNYCFPGWKSCEDSGSGIKAGNDGHLWRAYTFSASLRNRIMAGGG